MKRLIVIIAALLMLGGVVGCSSTQVKETKQDKCFTLENRTNKPMRMALCRENSEFFFAEVFEPMEIKHVCNDEVGTGTFIFCWQDVSTLNLDCLSFIVGEADIPTLYDDEVDIWVTPLTNDLTNSQETLE